MNSFGACAWTASLASGLPAAVKQLDDFGDVRDVGPHEAARANTTDKNTIDPASAPPVID